MAARGSGALHDPRITAEKIPETRARQSVSGCSRESSMAAFAPQLFRSQSEREVVDVTGRLGGFNFQWAGQAV